MKARIFAAFCILACIFGGLTDAQARGPRPFEGLIVSNPPGVLTNGITVSSGGNTTLTCDSQGCVIGRSSGGQFATRIAPLIAQETSFAGLWVGAAATAPTGSNYTLASNSGLTIFNTATSNFAANFASIGASSLNWIDASGAVTIFQSDKTTNAGTGSAFTVRAQNETGTTSVGGQLQLIGGTGTANNGNVAIQSGLDAGELEFTPVNGANNLTIAQSSKNVVNLIAGVTLGFTVTFARAVANTSLVFIRNNTSQTATIAYLSGGTITIATATSALVVSNGTNLVKLMVGT